MAGRAIVDTGYLVALLNGRDAQHRWATDLLPSLRGPWVTAEACISEAVFLLEGAGKVAVQELLSWLERGLLESRHFLPEELAPVRAELSAHGDRWVDFADACVVRLSDQYPRLPVVSVDGSDFAVYFRKRPGRRLLIPLRK
jgi:predicted nucleic acid-binding protein